jgi:hypothetical protein
MTNILKKLWKFLRKDIYNEEDNKITKTPPSYDIQIKEVKIKKIKIKN